MDSNHWPEHMKNHTEVSAQINWVYVTLMLYEVTSTCLCVSGVAGDEEDFEEVEEELDFGSRF